MIHYIEVNPNEINIRLNIDESGGQKAVNSMACSMYWKRKEKKAGGGQDKIKTFLDKQKSREFIISRDILQEILKNILQAEGKWPYKVVIHTRSTGKGNYAVIKEYSTCFFSPFLSSLIWKAVV